NTSSGLIVGTLAANAEAGEAFAAVISAPIVEEIGKAFILVIFFFWKKDEFDGVVDGIVYASMAALGFAMTENILYYGNAAATSGGVLTATVIVRGFFAPFSHPLFTSLTGIGLGLARQSTNMAVKILTPVVGLLMAIFMHSFWNASAVFGGGLAFVLTYIVVMVPAFLIILIVIMVSLRREGQVVRQFLQSDIERGFLTREEYEQLGSVFGRMGSSFNAFSKTGMRGWRSRRRFNQLASELAFHRSRVSRGIRSRNQDPQAQEAAYLHALQDLINELRAR
ncbi:MAG TPA: PrsW family intramembrane metalloprotease, partial [Pyrinomonadaceae bacterium]|nr:PrsW family intramembrane metalloprotease [Pyrinomonadaceae bacterium]